MTRYRLSDLLDLSTIQRLADANHQASGLPMSIIDADDGSVLVQAGWTEICKKFHRANPVSKRRCMESDAEMRDRLQPGEAHRYKCKNGLWHVALPIMAGGHHLATMFLSQFLFEGEDPDRDVFIHQAQEFGYDVEAYLEALDQMRVFSPERVDTIITYDMAIVLFISDLAEQALRTIETQFSLAESEQKYRTLVENINIGVFRNSLRDGAHIQANPAMAKIFGYDSVEEFKANKVISRYQDPRDRARVIEKVLREGSFQDLEMPMKRKDGTLIWCSCSGSGQLDESGELKWIDGVIEDITERKLAEQKLQKAHAELELRVMERTADLARLNQQMALEIAERRRIEEQLRELSEKDPLTKVYNRRKLSELLQLSIKNARRYARLLSLIMFDLDHFKGVNDRYGHDVGDAVLEATATIVTGLVRDVDIVARFGGEEFTVVCPETDIQGATALAERIRTSLGQYAHPVAGKVAISVGVAEFMHNDDEFTLIKRADEALYEAKNKGRNRVEVAYQEPLLPFAGV